MYGTLYTIHVYTTQYTVYSVPVLVYRTVWLVTEEVTATATATATAVD